MKSHALATREGAVEFTRALCNEIGSNIVRSGVVRCFATVFARNFAGEKLLSPVPIMLVPRDDETTSDDLRDAATEAIADMSAVGVVLVVEGRAKFGEGDWNTVDDDDPDAEDVVAVLLDHVSVNETWFATILSRDALGRVTAIGEFKTVNEHAAERGCDHELKPRADSWNTRMVDKWLN